MAETLYEAIKDIDLDSDPNPTETVMAIKYLDNLLRETQRLHSIVGAVGRTAAQDVTVMGKEFPKGTRFQIYIRAIHTNPKYYKDPESFLPDRWNEPQVPGAFLPFGDGPHNCIGRKLAEIEFKVVLFQLVKKYKFALAPGAKIEYFTTITHGLKDGLEVLVQKRT
ncbi:hypothetical protein HDU91_003159 [Kappamyces sp. JEL0680]|nr:hypothetical protein HDU91_003159 [Kappamyces sp. JEL0680]